MSDQLRMWDDGLPQPENRLGQRGQRASLARELCYLLTISTGTSRVGRLSPAGLAYSLGVALIEDFNMARGQGKGHKQGNAVGMPRFVDVKLSTDEKADFLRQDYDDKFLVTVLQSLADDGYRVGVSWSGENNSYTVSLTCRNPDSPNNGMCMTSFAKDVRMAIGLAVYKHTVVCEDENWLGAVSPEVGDFG